MNFCNRINSRVYFPFVFPHPSKIGNFPFANGTRTSMFPFSSSNTIEIERERERERNEASYTVHHIAYIELMLNASQHQKAFIIISSVDTRSSVLVYLTLVYFFVSIFVTFT